MVASPLAVLSVGLVSGVGLTAAESCAAIRCGINNFRETRFTGSSGEWLIGSAVELEESWRGSTKLVKMAARAVHDCLDDAPGCDLAGQIPLVLCTAEEDRSGRFQNLDRALLDGIERELGTALHPNSRVIAEGRVGGAIALLQARRIMQEGRCTRVIVAGVDSFLVGATLAAYDAASRLLTADNSNGFIPGEAAGAVLLASYEESSPAPLLCRGLGFAREPAPFGSGKPLRADGLVQAIRAALNEAGLSLKDCDHRIADVNGEQYRFKEAALAITRLLRDRKERFSLWHPVDCVGEVGAATLPAMLAMLAMGARHDYLPGPVFLGHLGNDDDKRAAFIVRATTSQTLALETAAEAAFSVKRRTDA
jgi:3-oxoacyl-[acyl-carrier-protein] synthase-1